MNLDLLCERLGAHEPIMMSETSTSAAVLILFRYSEQGVIDLLLTKRAQHLEHYAGDYCFPGGMKEPQDKDLKMTVIRETEEELGMCKESYRMIGQLDDFYDRRGHLVRPFVATMHKDKFEVALHPEIEKIYFFPLNELPNAHIDQDLERITKRHPAYKYMRDDVIIWGLTANIMMHLGNIIFASHHAIGKSPDLNG